MNTFTPLNSAAQRPISVSIEQQPSHTGLQGQNLTPIIYSGTAPVGALSAGRVVMPPRHLARAHVHNHTEIIVCVLEGRAATLWGNDMQPLVHDAGSMVWVPAGVPHAAVNLSNTDRVVAIEVRTDPAFNDDVELLPDLDEVAAEQVRKLLGDTVAATSAPRTADTSRSA